MNGLIDLLIDLLGRKLRNAENSHLQSLSSPGFLHSSAPCSEKRCFSTWQNDSEQTSLAITMHREERKSFPTDIYAQSGV